MIKIHVSEEVFDVSAEIAALAKCGGGAIANFIGLVRGDGDVNGLELEHYPAMTEKALQAIADQAFDRWPLHAITIVHRVGKLVLGDQIVLVCTASDHRQAALNACSYIMDRLKTDAPFWKKEWREDGSSAWVEERQVDLDASKKWHNS